MENTSGQAPSVELASRGHRLGAAMIDGIIAIVSVTPIMYATGLWEYVLKGQQPPYILTLGSSALGFAVFALVNGFFLKKSGQTIGKKMVSIQIVDLDGKVPGLVTLLGRRYLPIFLINLVPGVGSLLALIDDLFIFRSDRRCVHDLIAKTKVVLSGAKKSSANWLVRSMILLVIIFILGILAGVAIPAYKDYQRRVQEAEAKMATPAPAKPTTPREPSSASSIPAAPKPDIAVAGSPSSTTGAKPLATTPGVAVTAPEPAKPALAAGEPEAIYAKFHSAGLTANFNEMLKYGTAAQGAAGASMPAAARQEMLNFLAQMIPKSYSVTSKAIDPDGNHATLRLTAPGAVTGTATLIKEKGAWKVDNVNWGGSPKTSEPPSSAATGSNMGTKAKTKPVMRAKMNEPPAPTVTALVVAAPEPQKKVITTKFNDVFTAVMYRDLPALKELLELGWWVDKPDPAGTTPLMAAVKIDDPAIAKLLLEHGANPNIFARGDSALRLAKRNHNAAMVALLQHYGASVE